MTRNNLSEHLSWLLHSKLSVPTVESALPPVSISFTQADPTQAAKVAEEIAALAAAGEEEVAVESGAGDSGGPQQSTREMVRLRTDTGSASKPTVVTMGLRVQDIAQPRHASPDHRTGAGARVSSVPKPTLYSTARQYQHPPQQDVEIMDLTESLQQAQSPNAIRVVGRKRKSSEMNAGGMPSVESTRPEHAMQPPPRGSQQSFTAIDEIVDAPTDPPPPYSTIAPGLASPLRPSVYHIAPTDHTKAASRADPLAAPQDSEEDEDELIDFSRNRSRTPTCKRRAMEKQNAISPELVGESPSKPALPKSAQCFVLPENGVDQALRTTFSPGGREGRTPNTAAHPPSGSSSGNAQSEDYNIVEQVLLSQPSEIQACCDRLNARYERLLDQVAECMENDQDPRELQSLLDEAEERHGSMQSLLGKQKQYMVLIDEREQLRAALKSAIRSRSGVETARTALGACKEKTQTLVIECMRHLNICRNEAIEMLTQKMDGEGPVRNVAVQSTQARPSNTMAKQPYVPSPSRITQTQMTTIPLPDAAGKPANVTMPRRGSPPNIEAYFSPPRGQVKSTSRPRTVQRFVQRDVVHQEDDNEYGILDDSDMLEATNQDFSNRMGTPPVCVDDPDEFDDDIMHDYAEDLENQDAWQSVQHSAALRAPLAQTSGNSQARIGNQSPKRKKKQTPCKKDDLTLEHLFQHPWSDDVKLTLKTCFRLKGFRENQCEAINATLQGKDVFVLMPTGGGKSLCYQLPALVDSGATRGMTVVISPLLSLMEDQVQHLRKLNVQAFLINSETPLESRNAVMDAMNEPQVEDYIRLLYITPEMLSKSQKMVNTLERLYRRKKLARLVIDEAHCVSQWGHDFRPDYKAIGEIRQRFASVPVMALTATATENVKVDTVHNLGITGCKIFTSSFNRPNLYYEVRPKCKGKEDIKQIVELIQSGYPRKSGIIYCLSRKNCENMANTLRNDHKIKAYHYHAGLDAEEKRKIQRKWQDGTYHVIVATIAFGMGIDKPDVRFVIHHTIPKSLEGYYQETGRAGRDQLQSGCYLFYGYQDVGKLRRMVDDGDGGWEQKERQHQMLRRMAQYCDNRSDCRRVQVLRYFNEDFDREDCDGQCDNCCSGSNFQTVDFTEYAQQAISLVGKLAPQRATLLHCMDVFRGAATKKMAENGHDELDEYGAGKDLDRGDIERLFYHLLTERAIIEENFLNKGGFANQYAALGKHSAEFQKGKKKLQMQMRSTPKAQAKAPTKRKPMKDPFEEQSKKWKKAVGSRAPQELPMSTNISSPIQAAASRKQPSKAAAGRFHGNGYQRDNFVVSDPDDGDYAASDQEDFDDGFEPVRAAGYRQPERQRGPTRPITVDEMMAGLDEVQRDVIEGFVQEAKEEARKIMINKSLRMTPFSDTMLRYMAIKRTTTPNSMLSIPDINPENIRLYGKRFCKLVAAFQERYDEMQLGDRPDPNAQNVIDLVSDDEEESDDEYGDFPSEAEDEEGESSSYFQPPSRPAAVAAFTARVDRLQDSQAYSAPGLSKKPAAKGGKKRTYKATGITAAPRRKGFSGGSRFASFEYEGGSGGGVSKKRASAKRKSGGGGRSRGGKSAMNNTSGASRGLIGAMPT